MKRRPALILWSPYSDFWSYFSVHIHFWIRYMKSGWSVGVLFIFFLVSLVLVEWVTDRQWGPQWLRITNIVPPNQWCRNNVAPDFQIITLRHQSCHIGELHYPSAKALDKWRINTVEKLSKGSLPVIPKRMFFTHCENSLWPPPPLSLPCFTHWKKI